MGQINTNNYPTVNSLADADLLIVENATNGTGTTTPKQLRENAIGTDTLHTSAQSVTGAINELKGEIDAGAGVVCYDVDTITSGYLGGQFSGSANLLLLHLTTNGIADATNGYMMMLSYSRPVARFAYGRLVDADGAAYKQDVYADNTIICTISGSGEGTESDPVQVVILGIINAGFMLTPTAVVSDRDIIDGQGNTLSVLAEALTKTASGNPVVISDCAGGKARSLKTTIEALQDLHGYDHPWAGGAGKNKFPITVENLKTLNATGTWSGNVYTVSGGTITIVTDDSGNVTGIKANGTFNADVYMLLASVSTLNSILSGSYILNGCPSGGGESTYYIRIGSSGTDGGTGANVSTPFTGTNSYIFIKSGYTANNVLFLPMIRLSTESDASFAPWENKCPISGRTAVVVDDTGRNIWNEQWEIGGINATTGQNNDANNCIRIVGYIGVTPTQSIYLKFPTGSSKRMVVHWYDRNKNYIAPRSIYDNTIAVTVPSNAYYMRFYMTDEYGTTYGNNISVNYPSSFTDYVPYAHSSATIQLGTTVYGAEINWDTGVATIDRALVDLGSFNWFYNSDTNHERMLSETALSNVKTVATSAVANIISSMFKADSYDNVYLHTNDGIISVNAQGQIGIYSSIISTDATAFKTAVTGQTVCYELATPTTLQLTSTQLSLLKGYNRVTIDNGNIDLLVYIGRAWS